VIVDVRKSRTAGRQIGNHGRPTGAAILGAYDPREIPTGIANSAATEKGDVLIVGIDLDDIVVPALVLADVGCRSLRPRSATIGGDENTEVRGGRLAVH